MKEKLKSSKGITLIALVVTIVVLLILAGVSINLVVGNNGVINKSKEAKTSSEIKAIEEQAELIKGDLEINNSITKKGKTTPKRLLNAINSKLEGSILQGNKVITSDSKYVITVADDENLTVKVEKNNGALLQDGDVDVYLSFNPKTSMIKITPMIGGIETYEQHAQKKLNKMTYDEKINIVTTAYGMTKEEVEAELNFEKNEHDIEIDELLIMEEMVPGYVAPQNVSVDIKLNGGRTETIQFLQTSYIEDYIDTNGIYTCEVSYNGKKVTKSTEVKLAEKIDQSKIFEYTKEGIIIGIKPEYFGDPNQEYSTYLLAMYLSYGAPYLTIPSEINGTKIVGIGDSAFQGIENITEVNIPNTITSIGERAFNACYNLRKINIPNSVTSIGESAFYLKNPNAVIECQAPSKPIGWHANWNADYKGNNPTEVRWGVNK